MKLSSQSRSPNPAVEKESVKPRVLVVAGSDSGGGAGIQADIKTITMLGGFATTAVTALTAQNTLGVQEVLPIEPRFVALQMRSVLTDIGTDVIKTGMLGSARVVEAVADVCEGTVSLTGPAGSYERTLAHLMASTVPGVLDVQVA